MNLVSPVEVLSDGISDLYEVKIALPESVGNVNAVERHRVLRDQALAALKRFAVAQRAKNSARMGEGPWRSPGSDRNDVSR